MSGKRSAGRELNHDNWNDEEEEEDVGEFKKADPEELEKRLRKVAKRRIQNDSGAPPNANPFSGFGGFSGIAASTPVSSSSAFSFLSKIPSTVVPKTNGNTPKNDKTEIDAAKSEESDEYLEKMRALNVAVSDWIKTHVDENPLCLLTPVFRDYEKYVKQFEELKNKKPEEQKKTLEKPKETAKPTASFTFGIPPTPASTQTPASITSSTTPSNSVFNSFKFGSSPSTEQVKPPAISPAKPSPADSGISFNSSSEMKSSPSFGITPTTTSTEPKSKFTFGVPAATEATATEPKNKFSFGITTATPEANKGSLFSTPASSISFGSTPSSTQAINPAPAPAFSFGFANSTPSFGGFGGLASKPAFSFGNVAPSSATTVTEEAEDEEPPKNEFVPVVEDDSLYSKRCKVFVKGATDYVDRGVGTLYIKKVEEKIQMIVRNDTNLGNIIFNIMIVDGLPVSRLGKNNVMVVCIPTPDAKPPPTSVLLRVKTGEEADELLETINKYKK